MSRLFWKALLAFLVLPGTFAFLVPLTLLAPSWRGLAIDPLGVVPLLLGIAALLATVREFYVAGRGTLAPWSPPEHLVTTGLYRFSRNPMYVAVVMILFGWAALFHSGALLVYALAVAAAFHLRVVFGEEPALRRTHGQSWVRYEAAVPRWFFRFRSNNREVTP
jgi:protein-S-isoprenylcysteine O-methyltransferase Ste14